MRLTDQGPHVVVFEVREVEGDACQERDVLLSACFVSGGTVELFDHDLVEVLPASKVAFKS